MIYINRLELGQGKLTSFSLQLARNAKNYKKGLFRDFQKKRKGRELVYQLLNEDSKMLIGNKETTQLLSSHFSHPTVMSKENGKD